MKVSELTGAKLDYWVAKAEGIEGYVTIDRFFQNHPTHAILYSPSTNWSQGGPLVQSKRITLEYMGGGEYDAFIEDPRKMQRGKTALQAAMRCFVASAYGEEAPDES